MKMILDRMVIQNFKGIRDLDIHFSQGLTRIMGRNGTGKSSIVDAYNWILFGKDSHGNAPGSDAFREKPLDDDGKEIHNLETSVELFCRLDGQRFDLKRAQAENWVKKRGAIEATFQGNVSTYWVNGVEVKAQDFKQRIAAIAGEDVFRLVGTLSAFNALPWKERRVQLMKMAGTDVDGALLARDEYRSIADELAQRNIGIDDLRKVLADQRKKCNDELKILPVRIDEARKSLPAKNEQEIRDAEYLVKDSRASIATVDEQLAAIRAGSAATSNRAQRLALEQELISLKRRVVDAVQDEKRKLLLKADAASEDFRRLSAMYADAKRVADGMEKRVAEAEAVVNNLRDEYKIVKAESKIIEDTCPACGQPLPVEKMQETAQRFEAEKRARLADIQTKGKAAAIEANKLQAELNHEFGEVEKLKGRLEAAEAARAAANDAVRDFIDTPDYAAEPRISELESDIRALDAGSDTSSEEKERQLLERKRELQAIVDKNLAVLAARDAGAETEARIHSYEARQYEVAAQLAETEILIVTLEHFIQDRCGALEESINAQFEGVRWKLFDQQINGAIVDCCMAMIPCESGLVAYESANTAAQINCDIGIVNALSKFYDVEVPLFVDNAERVCVLADTEAQLVTLAVSYDDEMIIQEAK